MSLRPVFSIKKVIDSSGKTVIATASTTVLAAATDGTAWVDAADDSVPQGSSIKSIFLSVFVAIDESTQAATPLIDWYVGKDPGGDLTFPNPGATGGADNRRWIIHEEKGLTADVGGSGMPMIFKGVLKIPRKMQRFGRNDKLFIKLFTTNHVAYFCIKCIYKFYQ